MGGVKGAMKVSCILLFAHIIWYLQRLFVTILQNQTHSSENGLNYIVAVLKDQTYYKAVFDAWIFY